MVFLRVLIKGHYFHFIFTYWLWVAELVETRCCQWVLVRWMERRLSNKNWEDFARESVYEINTV